MSLMSATSFFFQASQYHLWQPCDAVKEYPLTFEVSLANILILDYGPIIGQGHHALEDSGQILEVNSGTWKAWEEAYRNEHAIHPLGNPPSSPLRQAKTVKCLKKLGVCSLLPLPAREVTATRTSRGSHLPALGVTAPHADRLQPDHVRVVNDQQSVSLAQGAIKILAHPPSVLHLACA
jgi:hypothetical protein